MSPMSASPNPSSPSSERTEHSDEAKRTAHEIKPNQTDPGPKMLERTRAHPFLFRQLPTLSLSTWPTPVETRSCHLDTSPSLSCLRNITGLGYIKKKQRVEIGVSLE